MVICGLGCQMVHDSLHMGPYMLLYVVKVVCVCKGTLKGGSESVDVYVRCMRTPPSVIKQSMVKGHNLNIRYGTMHAYPL
jgi:hypothetical protein